MLGTVLSARTHDKLLKIRTPPPPQTAILQQVVMLWLSPTPVALSPLWSTDHK